MVKELPERDSVGEHFEGQLENTAMRWSAAGNRKMVGMLSDGVDEILESDWQKNASKKEARVIKTRRVSSHRLGRLRHTHWADIGRCQKAPASAVQRRTIRVERALRADCWRGPPKITE